MQALVDAKALLARMQKEAKGPTISFGPDVGTSGEPKTKGRKTRTRSSTGSEIDTSQFAARSVEDSEKAALALMNEALAQEKQNQLLRDRLDLEEKLQANRDIAAEQTVKEQRLRESTLIGLRQEQAEKAKLAKFNAEMNAHLKGLIDGAMTGFANATGQMIQAVVEGRKSIGEGILGITKAVITGAGIQAMVLGALEMAKALAAIAGIFTAPLAAGHFAAGAAFFGVGALVTGLGAAIPSGASSARSGGATRAGSGTSRGSTFRPRTTGDRRGDDKQRTTVVNLEIHGGRPVAGAFWREQLEAQLRGAA